MPPPTSFPIHNLQIFPPFIYGFTALCWTLAAFSVSSSFYTVGMIPWAGDQPVARPLPSPRTAKTQNKRTQTSIPQVGFQPTIPVFKQAKTLYALDRAATVIGILTIRSYTIREV
jgi:hypothetical protein